MNLRERFENDPAVFGLGLIVTGFLAGLATCHFLEKYSISADEKHNTEYNCTIPGVAEAANNLRLTLIPLHEHLIEQENLSVDRSLISYDRRMHSDAADRTRKDIKLVNEDFSESIKLLKKRCE